MCVVLTAFLTLDSLVFLPLLFRRPHVALEYLKPWTEDLMEYKKGILIKLNQENNSRNSCKEGKRIRRIDPARYVQ